MNSKDKARRVLLYHTRKADKTLADFVDSEKLIGVTAEEVFNDNRDYIYQQMSLADLEAYKQEHGSVPKSGADLVLGMTLPLPCKIKVCPFNITAETAVQNTNWQSTQGDFYAFAAEQLRRVFESPIYSATVDKQDCDVEVVGWFKQSHIVRTQRNTIPDTVRGSWGDLSKYIVSLSTNSGPDGGTFVMRLPIVGFSVSSEAIPGQEGAFRDIVHESIGTVWNYDDKQFYAKKALNTAQLGNFFSALISYNDLLFISFARNASENSQASPLSQRVATKSWDMIGLVDDVRVSLTGEGAGGYVEVTGRDLMKLLIEDGSYFFNPSSAFGSESLFANGVPASGGKGVYRASGDVADVTDLGGEGRGLIKRLRNMASEIDIFAYKPMRPISYIIKGVVSQLSNIEVVPGDIFDFWDNRTIWKDIMIEEDKK